MGNTGMDPNEHNDFYRLRTHPSLFFKYDLDDEVAKRDPPHRINCTPFSWQRWAWTVWRGVDCETDLDLPSTSSTSKQNACAMSIGRAAIFRKRKTANAGHVVSQSVSQSVTRLIGWLHLQALLPTLIMPCPRPGPVFPYQNTFIDLFYSDMTAPLSRYILRHTNQEISK